MSQTLLSTITGIQFGTPNISPTIARVVTTGSASSSIAKTVLTLSSGTSANSRAILQSTPLVDFDKGAEITISFSGIFSPGVAGASSLAGVGSPSNGLFFGYMGNVFGVLRRHDGAIEQDIINLTSGATQTGNIVVTAGGASISIPVSNNDSVGQVATWVSSADFGNVGIGFSALNTGSGVLLQSLSAANVTGGITFSGNGCGISGNVQQIAVGVPPIDEWTPQNQWNIDPGDDSQSLPLINFQTGNIFDIKTNSNGYGKIVWSMRNPYSGNLAPVHIQEYTNSLSSPILSEAHIPMSLYVTSGSANSNVFIKTTHISSTAITESQPSSASQRSNAVIPVSVSNYLPLFTIPKGIYTNILTVRNNPQFPMGQVNQKILRLTSINYSFTGQGTLLFYINSGVSFSGGSISWLSANSTSCASYFTSTSIKTTGGVSIRSMIVPSGTAHDVDLTTQNIYIFPSQIYSVSVIPLENANAVSSDFGCSLVWEEIIP